MTSSKRRGRPSGTGPHQANDERLLRQAALRLFYGLSPNATSAFQALLGGDSRKNKNVVRRLQRHWQSDRDRYLEEARRHAFSSRWQIEADELAKASPELFRVIATFAASAVGQAVLTGYSTDGQPVDPMSLGIVRLWEEIVRHSAVGPLRAEELFDQAYTGWSVTGLEPDEAFLRRFAELCLAQADRLKAHVGMSAADDGAAAHATGLLSPSENHDDEQ